MSDIGETFDALNQLRKERGAERREKAAADFSDVRLLALTHYMTLRKHSDAHYTLDHPAGWQVNIYPGNHRLFHHPWRRGPRLELSADWTLEDVVRAAIEVTNHA